MEVSQNSGQAGKSTEPRIFVQQPSEELLKRYDRQTYLIIGVLVVALVTMVIMTGTLVVDSFHFNSATYQEYSSRIETQESLLGANKTLLEADKQDQEEVLRILKAIQESLKRIEAK